MAIIAFEYNIWACFSFFNPQPPGFYLSFGNLPSQGSSAFLFKKEKTVSEKKSS